MDSGDIDYLLLFLTLYKIQK